MIAFLNLLTISRKRLTDVKPVEGLNHWTQSFSYL